MINFINGLIVIMNIVKVVKYHPSNCIKTLLIVNNLK